MKTSSLEKRFVFVNPCSISGKTKAGEGSKASLLARRIEDAKTGELLFIPYNPGYLSSF